MDPLGRFGQSARGFLVDAQGMIVLGLGLLQEGLSPLNGDVVDGLWVSVANNSPLRVEFGRLQQETRSTAAKRRVIFRLTGTQENAPAQGQLRVSHVPPGRQPPSYGPGTIAEML